MYNGKLFSKKHTFYVQRFEVLPVLALTEYAQSCILMLCADLVAQEKKCAHLMEGIRMKSTGVVRKLDNLGRIVIPIELRKTMGIEIKDTLEIFTEGDEIILKKYEPGCIFCNDARDVKLFKGKRVCEKCLAELNKGE